MCRSDYSQRRTTIAAYVPVGNEPAALVADMLTVTFETPVFNGRTVLPEASTVAPAEA